MTRFCVHVELPGYVALSDTPFSNSFTVSIELDQPKFPWGLLFILNINSPISTYLKPPSYRVFTIT